MVFSRLKIMLNGQQFYSWLLSLFLLALAITINTFIVDEIVRLLDENIPVAKIQLERNLGWNLNMAASAFCLLSGAELFFTHLYFPYNAKPSHTLEA